MSWLGGYKSKATSSTAADREEKRKKLETERQERIARAKARAESQKRLQAAIESRQEADQALKEFLDIDPEIFDEEELVTAGNKSLLEELEEIIVNDEIENFLSETEQETLEPADTMVNYDQKNEDDDAGAIANARDVKLPFNRHDIKLWFSLIESKMQFAGIKKQWSKRQILIQLIPPEFHSDFKHYLVQQETEAGATAYFDLKTAMVKQFGPKRADGFDRAVSRVMTGTPSQLGRLIINDICPAVKPLEGCHCSDTVLGIWRRSLPSEVRNQIADMDFNGTTYAMVFDKADNVWSSNASSKVSAISAPSLQVAAVSTGPPVQSLDETLPALGYPVPEVAAMSRGGRGRGRGGRGRGGRGRATTTPQNNTPRHRGPKHPDLPQGEWRGCQMHHRWGRGAFFCSEPATCPWKNIFAAKPAK